MNKFFHQSSNLFCLQNSPGRGLAVYQSSVSSFGQATINKNVYKRIKVNFIIMSKSFILTFSLTKYINILYYVYFLAAKQQLQMGVICQITISIFMAVIAEKLTEKLEENHNAENVFFPYYMTKSYVLTYQSLQWRCISSASIDEIDT